MASQNMTLASILLSKNIPGPNKNSQKRQRYDHKFLYEIGLTVNYIDDNLLSLIQQLKLYRRQDLVKIMNTKVKLKLSPPPQPFLPFANRATTSLETIMSSSPGVNNIKNETLCVNMLRDDYLMSVVNNYLRKITPPDAPKTSKDKQTVKVTVDKPNHITTKTSNWFDKANDWVHKAEPSTSGEIKSDPLVNLVKNRMMSVTELESHILQSQNTESTLVNHNHVQEEANAVQTMSLAKQKEFERLRQDILVKVEHANQRLQMFKSSFLQNRQYQQGVRYQNHHLPYHNPVPESVPYVNPTANNVVGPNNVLVSNTTLSPSSFANFGSNNFTSRLRTTKDSLTIKGQRLTDAEILILSLLSLDPAERERYLYREAKERGIIRRSKKDPSMEDIDPKYSRVLSKVKRYANERVEQTAVPVQIDRKVGDQVNGIVRSVGPSGEGDMVVGKPPEPNRVKTFEEQVLCMVNNVTDLPPNLEQLKYYSDITVPASDEKFRGLWIDSLTAVLVKENKGHLHTGELRIHAKNSNQAFVTDRESRDVFISSPALRQQALHGDIVEIYVHHDIEVELPTDALQDTGDLEDVSNTPIKQKVGFVSKIIQRRHTGRCVGSFEPFKAHLNQKKSIKFIPRDTKMPVLTIPRQNWPNALLVNDPKDVENVLYMAEIVTWKPSGPIGNIIKPIGKCGELEAETAAILEQNSLIVAPFPDELVAQLPQEPFRIPDKEFTYREDLRKLCIFTIDPATARDLDDALSVQVLDNGNYEVGVHISDVSYFLQEDSMLDDIVKEKATTIYMIDNVYHMLPKPLCFLCSLLPGEDKLAFSVFWEINPECQVLKTRFKRTIINSCAQLSYDHAQNVIENPDKKFKAEEMPAISGMHKVKDITNAIKVLYKISRHLREKRMKSGALKIDQPKLAFRLHPETGEPTEYSVYELKEANRMIEDFMLLANFSVAAYIFESFPRTSILRSHPDPNENSLNNLEGTLKKFGYELDGRSSKLLRDSMEKIIKSSASPLATQTVLNVMLSKPMARARYFCSSFAEKPEEFYHFALSAPIYTHFTSPIRRYADVMVHRALSAALTYTEPSKRGPEELQRLAGICNTQKWNAKNAGDECSDLYFRYFITKVGSIRTKAAVLGMGQYSIEVVLLQTGHAIKIYYKFLEPFVKVEVGTEAKISEVIVHFQGLKSSLKLTLFSELDVEVTVQKTKLSINKIFPAK